MRAVEANIHSTNSQPFIELKNVSKSYVSGGREFLAVSDVSLSIEKGEMVSIVGPSGCGKTTVLKMLAGLHAPSGGVLSISGPSAEFNHGRDVGMVFQQPRLLKWRSILENVLLPAEILGLPIKPARARAKELLAMVGLSSHTDSYPHQLSGGMQQRASIARALVHDPSLILMDEPFGALDALTREQLHLEMLRIWEQSGKTIVFVTHSIQEAVFLGTQCAVMTAGPARMADNFVIKIDFPRNVEQKTTPEFGEYTNRIYRLLNVGAIN